jgi:putative intracellular protease/amidase
VFDQFIVCHVPVSTICTGLSWDEGKHATFTSENEEDVWELRLPVLVPDATIEFKPLLNDEAWARGHNYITKAGV